MQLEAIDAASDSVFEQSMLKALPALRRFAAACVDDVRPRGPGAGHPHQSLAKAGCA